MKSIEVVSIPVSDQQKSKSFFQSIGFEIIVEAAIGSDMTWLQLGIKGETTSISLVEKSLAHGPDTYFAKVIPGSLQGFMLETTDIEKDIKDFQGKGIVFNRIDDTPFGKFANFADPDQNGLLLHQKN